MLKLTAPSKTICTVINTEEKILSTDTKKWIVEEKDFVLAEPLLLDCGRSLNGVNLRYETYGKLNEDKNNAILVFHALSGDAHICGYHSESDAKPGWWSDMVGPGKYLDTDKYFIICSNVLGGCSGSTGPRSVNPDTGKVYNMDFPVITIRDMVRAQRELVRHLGIERLLAVIGGSMGGMQALEWAVNYPEMVQSVLPIATTTQLSAQGIAFNWVSREAIKYDPNFNNGDYTLENVPDKGLATARMLAHITYLSDESMGRKFGRGLQKSENYSFNFDYDFQVESYLEHQGRRFVERFDANSYFYITRAIDYYDLASRFGGNLANAFAHVKSSFLVVSFTSDWLFPSEQSATLVRALLKNNIEVSYVDIESSYGHDAFLLEFETLGRMVRDFVGNEFKKVTEAK